MEHETRAGRIARPATIKVWDGVVRAFHWSLVAAIAVAYLAEEGEPLHNAAGYIALGLVAIRIAWGFIGPRYARFADFVKSPTGVTRYLLEMARGHPRRYLGHNPAGGAMVVALLAMVALTAGSGWA